VEYDLILHPGLVAPRLEVAGTTVDLADDGGWSHTIAVAQFPSVVEALLYDGDTLIARREITVRR